MSTKVEESIIKEIERIVKDLSIKKVGESVRESLELKLKELLEVKAHGS